MIVIEALPVLALALCVVLIPLASDGMPGGAGARDAGRSAKDGAPVARMKRSAIRE